jgi:metallo-beta-lactamase family protein
MHIEFLGAAQTVTGSMHLVRTKHAAVLLDCGLYQGRRREAYERNRELELPVRELVESVEESKAVTASDAPAIVISASGMCEAGRILHHLQAAVGSPDNTVLIVGFQAQHTLGRRLVERRDRVRIFGLERERRCEVVVQSGFSAHADQRDLLAYAERCRERGRLERIALVHGDPAPQKVLAGLLRERGHSRIAMPSMGEALELVG